VIASAVGLGVYQLTHPIFFWYLNLSIHMNTLVTTELKIEPKSFDEWVNALAEFQMPIFCQTARNIHDIMDDNKKGTMELASVILQDPNLTLKLLKLSNSVAFNPSRQKIVTVSRAILNLGAVMVKEMTLLCTFFESIQSSDNKAQATEAIAQAIHAAMQAKALAEKIHDASPEEIFTATLLYQIGKISFWCFSHGQGERIQQLVKEGKTREAAEKSVLGFKLSDLSLPLSKTWKLGGLIEEAAEKFPISKNPRVQLVHLGHEMVDALRIGTNSKPFLTCIKKIENLTQLSTNQIFNQIKMSVALATDIVRQLGDEDPLGLLDKETQQQDIEPITPVDKIQLQFQFSQEIAIIINDHLDINVLLETVLEAIKRGVVMDRVLFSLLSANKQTLNEKLSIGWHKDLGSKIVFNVIDAPVNLFYKALSDSRACWFKPSVDPHLYSMYDVNVIGKTECFITPIFTNNKATGIMYADRAIERKPLATEDFNAFNYFTQQANMGLSIYRMQKSI
jgi:HD-like signal output (HDOD) protein